MWGLRWIPPAPQFRAAYGFQVIGRLKPGVTLEPAKADIATVAEEWRRNSRRRTPGAASYLEPLHDAAHRQRAAHDLDAVPRRRRVRPADLLRQRRQSAAGARDRAGARAGDPIGARRGARPHRPAAAHRKPGARGDRRRASAWRSGEHSEGRAVPASGGSAAAAVALAFDERVLAFCGVAALLVGMLFGLAPAWQATGFRQRTLVGDGRTSTGRGGGFAACSSSREVATAVLLLIGAGLLLRTLIAVEGVDRGYRHRGRGDDDGRSAGLDIPDPGALLQFFDEVEREMRAVPGVRSVAWTSTLPLGASDIGPVVFEIVGDPPPADASGRRGNQLVSTRISKASIPIVAGRAFTDRDTLDSPPVCIVSEAFVRNHLGGRSPIGAAGRAAAAKIPQPAGHPGDRRRRASGQGAARRDRCRRAGLRADGAEPERRHLSRRAPQSAALEGLAAAVRAAIGRVDKEKLVGVHKVMTLDDVAWEATGATGSARCW